MKVLQWPLRTHRCYGPPHFSWMAVAMGLLLASCQENEDHLIRPIPPEKTYLFWTSIGDHTIMRAEIDARSGTLIDTETLYDRTDGLESPTSIVVDTNTRTIYWTDYAKSKILRASWYGHETPEILYALPANSGPVELTLDYVHDILYWTHPNTNVILRAPTRVQGPVDTVLSKKAGLSGPWGIVASPLSNSLYWIEYRATRLSKMSLQDMDNFSVLYAGGSGFLKPFGLAIHGQALYILDNPEPGTATGDRILRGSADGHSPLTVLNNEEVNNCYSMAVDAAAGNLYWLNQLEDGGLYRASLTKNEKPVKLVEHIFLGHGVAVITLPYEIN